MAPTLEELSLRYQTTCEKIQDSILIVESFMGAGQVFLFNLNREISVLKSIDLSSSENGVERLRNVLEEYQKMLTYEKTRRRLQDQIQKTDEKKTMKDRLKTNRQARKMLNPYQKKSSTAQSDKTD